MTPNVGTKVVTCDCEPFDLQRSDVNESSCVCTAVAVAHLVERPSIDRRIDGLIPDPCSQLFF